MSYWTSKNNDWTSKDWVSKMVKEWADEIDRQIMNELFGSKFEQIDFRKNKLMTGAFNAVRHITLHVNV